MTDSIESYGVSASADDPVDEVDVYEDIEDVAHFDAEEADGTENLAENRVEDDAEEDEYKDEDEVQPDEPSDIDEAAKVRLNAALAEIDARIGRPPAEQVAAFADAHQMLQLTLNLIDTH